MRWQTIIVAIMTGTLGLAANAMAGNRGLPPIANQPILSSSQTIFPQILRGFTWRYDKLLLAKRMPGITPEDTSWTDKSGKEWVDSIYSGVSLKSLGPAMVEFDHDANNNVDMITISSYESRAEVCDPSGPNRPRDCRNRLNQDLMNLLAKTERYIASRCGRPRVYKAKEKQGVFPKPGQFPDEWGPSYKWELANAELILSADSDDSGWWAVSLKILNRSFRGH